MKNRRLQFIFVGVLVAIIAFWLAVQYLPTIFSNDDAPALQDGETRAVEFVVGSNLVDCDNGTTNRCLVVDGRPLYQNIQDFSHTAGCTYELLVEEYAIYGENSTPRDTSRYRYRLKEVTSRTCAQP